MKYISIKEMKKSIAFVKAETNMFLFWHRLCSFCYMGEKTVRYRKDNNEGAWKNPVNLWKQFHIFWKKQEKFPGKYPKEMILC